MKLIMFIYLYTLIYYGAIYSNNELLAVTFLRSPWGGEMR